MSYGGRETRRGRVEEENNQNYQKFILFNDNSNNLRGNQIAPQKVTNFFGDPALPAALKGRKYDSDI